MANRQIISLIRTERTLRFKFYSQELLSCFEKQVVSCRKNDIFYSKLYNKMFVLFPMVHLAKVIFFQFSLKKNICIYLLGKLDTRQDIIWDWCVFKQSKTSERRINQVEMNFSVLFSKFYLEKGGRWTELKK